MITDKQYRLMTAGIIVLFLLIGVATIKDYGMGWDEVTRWKSGDLKLAYYKALFLGNTEEVTEQMVSDRYPGLFDLSLSSFHSIFGGNRMLQGHMFSMLFGALCLASTAWLASLIFCWRTAFFSTLLLCIYPSFYGHAMINPKDIPFMATYSLGCASCFYLAGKIAALGRPQLLTFVWCGLAIGIAGATRIPGLVFLGIGPLIWAFTLTVHWRAKGEKGNVNSDLIHLLKGVVLSSISALLVVLVFFPRVQFQLFSSIPNVATRLHSSASEIPLLYNGFVSDAGAGPFAYAHRFFLVSTPIWMLALFFLGCVLLGRKLNSFRSMDNKSLATLLSFTGVAAFPWVYILITQPALHNGIRHMLFGMPPLVILMGFCLTELLRYIADQNKLIRISTTILLVGFILTQTAALVLMHPYQYVAFNSLAGEKATIPNRYETEYWFTSSKHLLDEIPQVIHNMGFQPKKNEPVKIRISGPLDAAHAFVPRGFILVDDFDQADFYISNTTMRTDLLADGEIVYQIDRGGIPIGVIKKLK